MATNSRFLGDIADIIVADFLGDGLTDLMEVCIAQMAKIAILNPPFRIFIPLN
ncbi:hypothetical protein [Microbulbifer sp. TRSA005]|uniref:hypothetical protein n=1 Tax=unclassified Microbulbifer TaxID=2619833 RepID=UPI0040390B64